MNEIEKFKTLKKETDDLSNKKIRLEERYSNEKKQLEELVKKIIDKGYDPKKLSEIKSKKEEELKKLLNDFQKQIEDTKEKLNKIEV